MGCITHMHLQRNGFVQNHETNQSKLIWAETETGDIEEEKVNDMMCYRTKSRKPSLLKAMMRRRSTIHRICEELYKQRVSCKAQSFPKEYCATAELYGVGV